MVYEVIGGPDGVGHRLRVPKALSEAVLAQLRGLVPGVRVRALAEVIEHDPGARRDRERHGRRVADVLEIARRATEICRIERQPEAIGAGQVGPLGARRVHPNARRQELHGDGATAVSTLRAAGEAVATQGPFDLVVDLGMRVDAMQQIEPTIPRGRVRPRR